MVKTSFVRFSIFGLILVALLLSTVVQPAAPRIAEAQEGLTPFQAQHGDLVEQSAEQSGRSEGIDMPNFGGRPEISSQLEPAVSNPTLAAALAREAQASPAPSSAELTAMLAQNANAPSLAPHIWTGQGVKPGPLVNSEGRGAFEGYTLLEARENAGYYYTPPDTMGVVGAEQFAIVQNGYYMWLDKETGEPIPGLDVAAHVFWPASVDPNDNAGGDPRVRYDRLTDRWVISAFTRDDANRVVIAVSDGPVIGQSTIWTYYYIEPAAGDPDYGCFIDYPMMGVDVHAIYIGANMFYGGDSNCALPYGVDTSIWVLAKNALPTSGGNVTALTSYFPGLYIGYPYMWSPMPADNNNPHATEGFFVGHGYYSDTIIAIPRVQTPWVPGGATLDFSFAIVSDKNDGWPVGVPYPGNPIPAGGGCPGACDWGLDAIGYRAIGNATVRKGSLWTAMSSSVDGPDGTYVLWPGIGDRNSVVWWELDLTSGFFATVLQEGNVYDRVAAHMGSGGDPVHMYMGSINVSGQGHALVGFTGNNTTNIPPSGGFAARLRTSPAGLMTENRVFWGGTNTGDIRQSFETGNRETRWGDYSMTSVDPCNDQTFYTVQEYQAPGFTPYGGNWGVAAARVWAPGPAPVLTLSPTPVEVGQITEVTIDGDLSGPEEYFDTDRSVSQYCGQRLQVHITNGVKTKVIGHNPGRIIVEVDATSAEPGGAILEICNPDGQCVQSGIAIVGGTPGLNISDPAISKVGVLQPGQLGLPGEQVTWEITVTNVGSETAPNVVLTDTVPSELQIDGVTTSQGSYSVDGQTVTVNIGSMAPGAVVDIQIVTTVLSSPASGVIVNTASVSGLGDVRTATASINTVTGLPSTGYPPGD